jgi:hypothetical protein
MASSSSFSLHQNLALQQIVANNLGTNFVGLPPCMNQNPFALMAQLTGHTPANMPLPQQNHNLNQTAMAPGAAPTDNDLQDPAHIAVEAPKAVAVQRKRSSRFKKAKWDMEKDKALQQAWIISGLFKPRKHKEAGKRKAALVAAMQKTGSPIVGIGLSAATRRMTVMMKVYSRKKRKEQQETGGGDDGPDEVVLNTEEQILANFIKTDEEYERLCEDLWALQEASIFLFFKLCCLCIL